MVVYLGKSWNDIGKLDYLGLTKGAKNSLILLEESSTTNSVWSPLPPTAQTHALISLKGSFATTMSIKINGYTWLDLFRNMALLSPQHALAEPLTPHTVSRNTNRKLRHCGFTGVHLDQRSLRVTGGLWGGRIKVCCQVRQRNCICREVELFICTNITTTKPQRKFATSPDKVHGGLQMGQKLFWLQISCRL